jgi:hypothetical protein
MKSLKELCIATVANNIANCPPFGDDIPVDIQKKYFLFESVNLLQEYLKNALNRRTKYGSPKKFWTNGHIIRYIFDH